MFYANSIRCFLSSREGLVSILRPSSIRKKYFLKKYFAKFLFTQKQMMGKKKLAPLTPLLLCVANIDWAMSALTGAHTRITSPPRLFSLTEAVYWASVTGDIDIAIIVIQLCQQVHSQHHNIIHIIIFAFVPRCEVHQLSKHVTLSQFEIEFVSLACCSTSRCTFSWRNVY